MIQAAVETPDLHEETNALVLDARAITITTTEECQAAADFLNLTVKALERKIVEVFAPMKDAAHKAHKTICASESEQLQPVREAERIVKDAIKAFQSEQRRLAEEDARRRQEEQRKLDEERRLQEALELEADGEEEAAMQVISAPARPALVPVRSAPPKVSGIATKTTYSARVVDPLAFLKHIVANPHLLALVTFNMTALNMQARSLKGALNLPGVVVEEDSQIAAGGRR